MSRNVGLTPEQLRVLATWAFTVALQAPEELKRGSCYIPASTVRGIRKALEEVGLDWRAGHHKQTARVALEDARRVRVHEYMRPEERVKSAQRYVKKARKYWHRALRRQTRQEAPGAASAAKESEGA